MQFKIQYAILVEYSRTYCVATVPKSLISSSSFWPLQENFDDKVDDMTAVWCDIHHDGYIHHYRWSTIHITGLLCCSPQAQVCSTSSVRSPSRRNGWIRNIWQISIALTFGWSFKLLVLRKSLNFPAIIYITTKNIQSNKLYAKYSKYAPLGSPTGSDPRGMERIWCMVPLPRDIKRTFWVLSFHSTRICLQQSCYYLLAFAESHS